MYRPNPEFTPEVVSPQEPWRKALMDAAGLIRKEGWCQNSFGPTWGPSCLVGAIFKTAGVSQITADAVRAVTDHIGGESPMWWNDRPGRTAEEVIAALESAAQS